MGGGIGNAFLPFNEEGDIDPQKAFMLQFGANLLGHAGHRAGYGEVNQGFGSGLADAYLSSLGGATNLLQIGLRNKAMKQQQAFQDRAFGMRERAEDRSIAHAELAQKMQQDRLSAIQKGMQAIPEGPGRDYGMAMALSGAPAHALDLSPDLQMAGKAQLMGLQDVIRQQQEQRIPVAEQQRLALTQSGQDISRANVGLSQQRLEQQGQIAEQNLGLRQQQLSQTNPVNKPLSDKAIADLSENAQLVGRFGNLISGFKKEYADLGGPGGVGAEKQLEIERRLGKNPDRADWWQQQSMLNTLERKPLFGATLTGNELQSWREATVYPGMKPDLIVKNLARRQEIAKKYLGRLKSTYASGSRQEQIESATTPETPGAPIDLPSNAEMLIPGQPYTRNGVTLIWTGSGWK